MSRRRSRLLLDNDELELVRGAMEAFPWPTSEGFFSTRIFLIIQSGLDLAPLAEVVHDLRDRENVEVVGALKRKGISQAQAELVAAFTPLAFGRILLEELPLRFANEAVLDDGKTRKSIRLSEDALFRNALNYARHAKNFLGRERFGALALHSTEVRAVNEALKRGSEPQNVQVGPPIIAISKARPFWRFWR